MGAPNHSPGWLNVGARGRPPMIPAGLQLMIATVFVFVGAGINQSRADVIWVRGQSAQVYGQIVSMTDTHYEVRVFERGQFSETVKIERSTIQQAVSNISVQRLTQLDPSNAAAYRDYAEELAVQKTDPSARDLARRLYLIAAAHSDGTLRSSALLGLISIAESNVHRRRLEILRSLVDPHSTFTGIAGEQDSKLDSVTADQKRLMLKLIHAIRKEKSDQAIKLLTPASNRNVFDLWSDDCGLEELDRMARVNRPGKSQLAKLLIIESRIMSPQTNPVNPSGRKLNWGDFATQVSGTLGALPSFNNVTRFDPEKSVYREGRWVKP
jgi:hypothetical protein